MTGAEIRLSAGGLRISPATASSAAKIEADVTALPGRFTKLFQNYRRYIIVVPISFQYNFAGNVPRRTSDEKERKSEMNRCLLLVVVYGTFFAQPIE
jgi:hypothetical protein